MQRKSPALRAISSRFGHRMPNASASLVTSTDGTVEHTEDSITINGDTMKIFAERDPANLPWADLGVDYVLECTGFFRKREDAAKHLQAGAKFV